MEFRMRGRGNAGGDQKAGAFVGVIFGLLGIGMLVGGIFWGLRTREFIARAERADGRVIEMVAKRDSDGDRTYSPTVQFMAKDGTQTTFTSSVSSNPPSHREGDAVKVLYDPANPRDAKIESFTELWFGPLLLGGVMGVIFTLVGVGVSIGGFREIARKRRLRAEGLRIMAQVQGIEGAAGFYVIVAGAKDQRGVDRIFRSAAMRRDPGPKMLGRSSIEVIVDPNDYGTYDIDLAFLKD
jgi:hypothetical protein